MNASYCTQPDKEIAVSKLQLLVEQNRVTFFSSNMGVPTTVAVLLYLIGISNPIFVSTWLVSGYMICLARSAHHRQLCAFDESGRPIESWEKDLMLFSALSGCFWSTCGILFMDTADTAQSLVVISALFGVLAGSVPALTSHRQIFLVFVLCTWTPTGIYFFLKAQPLYLGIGVLGTFFVAIIIAFSISQIRAIEESLRIRYENSELFEELRIQKQKAEDANEAKSRFLAAASHDLRQPIHAMRLFSDSLSQRITDAGNRSIMAKLNTSIATLSELFDSLLDISKLDADAIVPEMCHLNVSELLRSLATEVSAQCHAKGLKWTCRCSKPFYVNTDSVLLERILRNLIWNAIKYTSSGGILIAARRRKDFLRIEIWDSGCGIPETEQPKIFTEFHQVEVQGTEAREGIGLGLSIVDRLCQLLGYTISLRSNLGQGSAFFVEMPLLQSPPEEIGQVTGFNVKAHIFDSDLNGVEILVVDDDQTILSATSQILEEWGCKPLLAASAEEVKHLLEAKTPDLILTDYNLKNSTTGDQIIELVHQETGLKIPSLIITGDTSTKNLKEARLQCDRLLNKPIKPEMLRESITLMLNQQLAE